MELSLAVETPHQAEPRAVTIDLAEPLEPEQTRRVFELCGNSDDLAALARGDWNETAARAIVFVKLEDLLPDLTLVWEEFTADFGMPNPELEQALPVEDL